MTKQDELKRTLDRRAFLRFCGRSALAGALAFSVLRLFSRRQVPLGESPCVNRGICSGCRVYRSCSLPQALSRRRTERGG